MPLPIREQLKYWGAAALLFFVLLWMIGNVMLPFLVGGALAYFLDPFQHLEPQRQPGINPCRLLFDHPRPQHVAVRDDLRLGGVFLEHGQEIAGQAHGQGPLRQFAAGFRRLADGRQAARTDIAQITA